MTELSRERMRSLDVERARRRRQRRCGTCRNARVVCVDCARTFCETCDRACPRCGCTTPAPPYIPGQEDRVVLMRRRPRKLPPLPLPSDLRLQEVLRLCTELEPTGIEPHPDSGGWQMILPVGAGGYDTAAQAAQAVYARAEDWVVPTSFGSGRLFHPNRWYITMHLR